MQLVVRLCVTRGARAHRTSSGSIGRNAHEQYSQEAQEEDEQAQVQEEEEARQVPASEARQVRLLCLPTPAVRQTCRTLGSAGLSQELSYPRASRFPASPP